MQDNYPDTKYQALQILPVFLTSIPQVLTADDSVGASDIQRKYSLSLIRKAKKSWVCCYISLETNEWLILPKHNFDYVEGKSELDALNRMIKALREIDIIRQ